MKTPINDTLELIGRLDVREKMKNADLRIPALPLLEYDLQEIMHIEHRLPPEAQLKDIIHTAMISPSGHWATCAIKWLLQGFPLDDDIREWYQTCKKNKRVHQRIRQAAHRLFKNQT
ncbi:hypothetical protein NT6N_24690 [Oceaniferula spumae]|uniref:Transposase n=1 Tax=Oceaniferula spumae TaxID=2979115 RepID=A0AAT9FNE9_9BACT